MIFHHMPSGRWLSLLTVSAGLLLLIGVASYLTQAIVRQDPIAATDFSNLWASGRLVGRGDDPYSSQKWHALYEQIPTVPRQDDAFVYPLPTAVLFVPLGLLSEPAARDLWLVISQLLIVGTALISAAGVEWRRSRVRVLPFIILSLLIYVPAMFTVMNGQIISLLGFFIAGSIYLMSRKRWGLAGAVLGLLILKPAGGGIFLGAAGLWLVMRKKWGGIAGILAMLGLCVGLAWFIQPGWIAAWLRIGSDKLAVNWAEMPTLWGICALLIGSLRVWPIVAGGLTALLVLGGVWGITKVDAETQPLWLSGILLPLILFVTPYLHSYDLVLLIPATVTMMALLDRAKAPFVAVSLFPLSISLVAVCFQIMAMSSSLMIWVMFPLLIMAIYLAIWQHVRKQRP